MRSARHGVAGIHAKSDPREVVVATARAMLAEGLVSATEGNVSVRDGDLVHITPADLGYHEMEASGIVTLDLGGNVVGGTRAPSSERRVHLALYAADGLFRAVVHTHSEHAIRWSERGEPLTSAGGVLEQAAGGPVRTATRADAGSVELSWEVAGAMEGRLAVLMAGHGVVAVGTDAHQALALARLVEHAAQRSSTTP